ncbi:MAG: redox-regulated ATPase YchF [Vicinamibacteria bacterium]|nr:redox-regulated ATPase YchF [Vicinamibacteria bacterium]
MRVGLVGLPMVGKSSLFQLLTGSTAAPPGGRPEARIGIARVPDPRVDSLADIFHPKKKTYATIEYVDVPGVAKGEGSSLTDLTALRGIDALVHVVRAFASDSVPHSEGSVDPLRDAQLFDLELVLADLGTVERRLERLEQTIKKTHKAEDAAEQALFARLKETLEAERPLRELELNPDERKRVRGYGLLSEKPLILAVNLGEDQIRQADALMETWGLKAWAAKPSLALCPISAAIEAELTVLSAEEAQAFRDDLGLKEPGLDRIIRVSYALLGLISFLTAGEDECRAWTIRAGTRAQNAAGAVHSDIERGFIRAEVVACGNLLAAGSLAACREQATLRLEGKDYIVQDGDVINFRFAV